MILQVLVDTGPLVALYRRTDEHHASCVSVARQLPGGPITCWPVLTEAAWLLRDDSIALHHLLDDVAAGVSTLRHLDIQAARWINEFLKKYRQLSAQLADAALMYLAEKEHLDTIFTLDRRDFGVYRFSNGSIPKLLPE